MAERIVNDYSSQLDGAWASGASPAAAATFGVDSITDDFGDAIPSTGEFRIRLEDEICRVTRVGAGALQLVVVERGAEGTTAAAHADNTPFEAVVTAASFNGLQGGLIDRAVAAPFSPANLASVAVIGAANRGRFCRVIVPKTGTLMDLSVFIGTSSGNIDGGVYDTQSTRNRLWSTGSIASPGTGWRNLGDPNLAVVEGQSLDFGVAADNNTVTFGRQLLAAATASALPAGYWPGDGANPRLSMYKETVFPLPGTITEATLIDDVYLPFIMARVV